MTNASELHDESSEGVKISDKRRIDPQTGQPRDESAANQNSGEMSSETLSEEFSVASLLASPLFWSAALSLRG